MPKLKFDVARAMEIDDAREIPAYTIVEAAQYLRIPVSTLRTWVKGRKYPVQPSIEREFAPIIELLDPNRALLSFFNLAEAHVLRALRTVHGIRLHNIRAALDYVRQKTEWDRPLIQEQFKTDGVNLFVEHLGQLIDASAQGQLVLPEVLAHLERIDWEQHLAARIYPFTRLDAQLNAPRSIVIDPNRSFGRPILDLVGVTTATIAERYKAGDSIELLVKDYDASQTDIEEAIRCELQIGVAA